ncbi:MAG: alpha/beta hydrolase family protein [Fidelibacterota bacterium]
MKFFTIPRRLLFLLLALFIISCEKTGDNQSCGPDSGRGHIISTFSLGTITIDYLQQQLKDWDFNIGIEPENDVQVYKIVYETVDWNDNPRQASGALYIPNIESKKGFPLLSSQHGTETKQENVASVIPILGFDALFSASTGYVACAPDYLGMGVSTDVFHPYIHSSIADAVVDFIRATRSFCCSNNISLNGQLFLAGYSEGGYATMATHKAMEEQFPDEFDVTASAPMAGPYDVLGTAIEHLNKTTYLYPSYFGYVSMAYSAIYGWDRLDEIFQSPYAEIMPDLFDGSHSGSQINSALTTEIDSLFQPQFLTAFKGSGETEIKSAFQENNLLSWNPKAPIRLYHGDADEAVPYSNSVEAEKELKARGADIELITIPGASHGGGVLPAITSAKQWFDSLKQ